MNNQQGVLYLINPVIHQLSEGMNDQRKNKEQLSWMNEFADAIKVTCTSQKFSLNLENFRKTFLSNASPATVKDW